MKIFNFFSGGYSIPITKSQQSLASVNSRHQPSLAGPTTNTPLNGGTIGGALNGGNLGGALNGGTMNGALNGGTMNGGLNGGTIGGALNVSPAENFYAATDLLQVDKSKGSKTRIFIYFIF